MRWHVFPHVRLNHRDILIEATSSQKVCVTSVSTGDQGSATTDRIWNKIDIFQISDGNLNYALNHQCNRL